MSGDSSGPKIAVFSKRIFVTTKIICSGYPHKSKHPLYKSVLNQNILTTNNARRSILFESRHKKSLQKQYCNYYDMFSTHFNYTFTLNIEIFITH